MQAVVGAARVVFGADTSEFDAKAKGVEGVLGRLVETFRDVEKRLKQVGLAATVGITVPFAGMVATIDKGAGQFEAAMNRVAAALPKATTAELDALGKAARRLGPAVGKGATEAADAVDSLARAGLNASDILGGALAATLKLATAGKAEAADAAGLVTDVMGQFGKTAADLPAVMTQVVGALDATKMEFDDFRLAVGQGGAIAAASGIDFLDFATTIAATSTQFASGADAGTSYKTFLQALTPNSKAAERAMRDLGISFFDAQGNIKPMAEQAEMLKRAMAGLSDEQRSEKLKDIFGADAARTAIGLMKQGREGYEEFRATVAGGDVEAKVAKAMEGTEQAGKNIANAWQEVKIAFGIDTGLIDIIARIKNGFASLLLGIANLPVGVRQAGIAIAALGAAIGPLIWAVAHVGAAIVANFAAAKFGVIGRVLGLLISPVSTVIGLLGEYGLSRVVAMLASRLLALTGPVGWAIGAILLFKDNIVAGLRAVWSEISATLGPPLAAIMEKVQGIFAKLSGGSIGASIGGLMDMLGALKDFIGNGLTAAILVSGEIIERALGVIVAAIGGLVDVVSGVVDVISALLQGDFAGAWEAVRGIVESVIDAVVDMVAALVPELGSELQQVYALAKQWLADGFTSISGWVGDAVASMVAYVANAFPGVVAAAKAVYAGVKGWLVDNFAGVVDWVRGAVKQIVDLYQWMAKAIGLDVAIAVAAPKADAPPVEKKAPPPAAPPRLAVPGGDDDKKKKAAGGAGRIAKPKERDAAEDAADRARIASQNALEAARLRGDRDAEDALRRQLDLEQQIEAYKRTGLSVAAATAAATRDMAALDAARRDGMARELALDQAAHELEVAKITGNRSLVETLERQDEIAGRIRAFQREGLSLVEATLRAGRQQLEVDEARAQVRARLLADEAQDRAAELARLRGDSAADQRKLQRDIDIRKRAREIEQRDGLAPGEGVAIATAEWTEADRARQTGEFRTVFRDGFKAAMSGDLKGWVSNWWKERMARGMEDAINSLADAVAKLFAGIGKGSGGGGLEGAFASIFGAVFGGKKAAAGGDVGLPPFDPKGAPIFPGFKDGGSFRVAGRSGIDANLVAFRATRGEMVDIRHGNDNGPAGAPAIVELRVGAGEVFDARVAAVSGDVQVKTTRSTNERAAMAARQNLNG